MAAARFLTCESEAAWHAERRQHLGASEVADVCGLTKYGSLRVWAVKRGLLPPGIVDPPEYLQAGHDLEPVIIGTMYRRRLPADWQVEHCRHVIAVAAAEDWMACSPDGLVYDAAGALVGGVDSKNVGTFASASDDPEAEWGTPGTDEVPLRIWVQCQWSAAVHDVSWWDVASLHGGSAFKVYRVHRDDVFLAALIRRARAWWLRYVVGGEEPPQTRASAAAHDADVTALFPDSTDAIEPPTVGDLLLAERLLVVRQAQALLDTAEKDLLARLKGRCGEAGAIGIPGAGRRGKALELASWKKTAPEAKVRWDKVVDVLAARLEGMLGPATSFDELQAAVAACTERPDGWRPFLFKPKTPAALGEAARALLPRVGPDDRPALLALAARCEAGRTRTVTMPDVGEIPLELEVHDDERAADDP